MFILQPRCSVRNVLSLSPGAAIPNSELIVLHSRIVDDQEYKIIVALPVGYAGGSESYLVLYQLDTDLGYGTAKEVVRRMGLRHQAYKVEVPDLIVVGIR